MRKFRPIGLITTVCLSITLAAAVFAGPLGLFPFFQKSTPERAEPGCPNGQCQIQARAPDAKPIPIGPIQHPRGHKPAPLEVRQERHRASHAKHAAKLQALPVITALTYDAVALGYGPAVNDQAQCGDCYINSGLNAPASALLVAGIAPKGSGFQLSFQYMLDCHPELGGCNGGDEYQVSQLVQQSGCPSAADYPGQGQSPSSCQNVTGKTLYTVSSLVFCSADGSTGVAATQDIKNCVAAYGYVSVAAAANSDWDSYQAGQVLSGAPDPSGINHAIGIVGWKTAADNVTTIWKVQNSWGVPYGESGYLWVKEGSYSIGFEAYAAIATGQPAPPGPVPPTPAPTPTPPPPAPPSPTVKPRLCNWPFFRLLRLCH